MKIRVLDEHTINKIAAGEVIENPSSVVKELVENSLDAGSTEIVIEIMGGGRSLIRISDNGCGMEADDALLCLERYATSKIREVEQLHQLSTMGFRGEALPSIASISKFTLITSPAWKNQEPQAIGTMIMVEGGKVLSCAPIVRSQGTTIEVKALFFNLPVRKKFLKSPAVDANEIQKTVSLISLGHPEIRFQLIVEGKAVFTHLADREAAFGASLDKRIATVLGEEFTKNSAAIRQEGDEVLIEGRLGMPSQSRHNRTGQYLFINRRPVFSPLVAYAVKQGYGTALPDARFPSYVLHMAIPGHLIDVNVHPQKKEVRLRQETQIKELISKSVRQGLYPGQCQIGFTPTGGQPLAFPQSKEESLRRFETVVPSPLEMQLFSRPVAVQWPPDTEAPIPSASARQPMHQPMHPQAELPPLPPVSLPKPLLPKVIATLPRFILLEGSSSQLLENNLPLMLPGGLWLVDQKAAHTRLIFDQLVAASQGASVPQQSLLIPYQFELAQHEADLLRHSLDLLHAHGIQVREFGRNAFLVDTLPQFFGTSDPEQFFRQLLADLADPALSPGLGELLHSERVKKLALAASRSSATNEQLSLLEAQELMRRLAGCADPWQAPTGKRIFAYLSPEELQKYFQRAP